MENNKKNTNLNQIAKISHIFKTTPFKPLKLIKGRSDFARSFGIINDNYQKDFDSKTVIYEGLLKNKPSIIKIYLHPEKEIDHFQRELYVYSKIRKQNPVWKKISAALLNSNDHPLPFLILEKLSGSPLGDWFHIKNNKIKPLKELLKILPLVYQQTKLPKKYAYASYDNLSFFLKKTEKMKRTLSLVKKNQADLFWQSYLNLGKHLKTEWNSIPNGFIFSDLNPANIFLLKKGGIRIIDFDAVSLGKKAYDYAFLYYASIGGKLEKFFLKNVAHSFLQSKEKHLFILFFSYFSLTHSWSFAANKDFSKFHAVMNNLWSLIC